MSEFYIESVQLNLSKQIFNFTYQDIQVSQDYLKQASNVKETKQNEQQQKESEQEKVEEQVKENTFVFLQEKDMILNDINNLIKFFYAKEIMKMDVKEIREFPFIFVKNRLCYIFQKYQEQSVLLEQVQEEVIESLMKVVKIYTENKLQEYLKDREGFVSEEKNQVAREFEDLLGIIYNLCKVRNYKNIIKHFPHEVSDLERVVFYLLWQKDNQSTQWESKYVFLLWLSVIILVPFDLDSIDSHIFKHFIDLPNIQQYLLNIAQQYLAYASNAQNAACVFISKYFQRPDIQKTNQLELFIQWCSSSFHQTTAFNYKSNQIGILLALFEIFKIGQRHEIIKQVNKVLQFIQLSNQSQSQLSVIKHYKAKLIQRLALVLLKPKLNTWTYQRGKKQMQIISQEEENVGYQNKQEDYEMKKEDEQQEEDEVDWECLESIIQSLLESLKEKDTIIRWSAAKGMGRIVERLDMEQGQEVIQQIIEECFLSEQDECSWHGGCLAIAELIRRGLIRVEMLEEICRIIKQGLVYEYNRGSYSVGSNVRDSACYCCWALARTYEPQVMEKYIGDLSKQLLLVSLFDKEVNCRRAAASAFQEHVGRQSIFPNGIEILTEADYFTLGNRTNSFLQVAPFVASFSDYFPSIAHHLVTNRLHHIDPNIRSLAAGTLSLISPININHIIQHSLPTLINQTYSEIIHVRQGALLGIADLLLGIKGISNLNRSNRDIYVKASLFLESLSINEKKLIIPGEYRQIFIHSYSLINHIDNIHLIPKSQLDEILLIVDFIEKKRLFRGKGGELMRIAVCRFIESIGMCHISLEKSHILRYFKTLEECIKNPIENIQVAGINALREFSKNQQTLDEGTKLITKFIQLANKDPNVAVTRGYSQALGVMNKILILQNYQKIFEELEQNTVINIEKDLDDSETRKYSVKSIEQILIVYLESTYQVGFNKSEKEDEYMNKGLDVFLKTIQDYSVDKRGDIGSMVREQTMESIYKVLEKMKELDVLGLIGKEYVLKLIQSYIQQLVEKIDRVRLKAGYYLQKMVDKGILEGMCEFPSQEKIVKMFNQDNVHKLAQKVQLDLESRFDHNILILDSEEALTDINNKQFIYYWNHPSCVYPVVLSLINQPDLAFSLLQGLCISIGDLTESNQRASQLAFTNQISLSIDHHLILDSIILIIKSFPGQSRQIIPTFKTLSIILQQDSFIFHPHTKALLPTILQLINYEINHHKNIYKLLSISQLIIAICNINQEISQESFKIIRYCLFHKFPKVRQTLADALYLLLLADGNVILGEHKNEQICDLLIENNWLELEIQNLDSLKNSYNSILQS